MKISHINFCFFGIETQQRNHWESKHRTLRERKLYRVKKSIDGSRRKIQKAPQYRLTSSYKVRFTL